MGRIIGWLVRWGYLVLRPLIWKIEAEKAHGRVLGFLSSSSSKILKTSPVRNHACEVLGIKFPNRFGLAAGFIKDPEHLEAITRTAFGFVEVGSISGLAQEGNPLPRMFRFPREAVLLNRMGFNNLGAFAAARDLAGRKPDRPWLINIGKSKLAQNEDDAVADMAGTYALLKEYGSAHVFNLASPNTPGLRQLLRPAFLDRLSEQMDWRNRSAPVLIKVHADLEHVAWEGLMRWMVEAPVDGVVCGNTTVRREGAFAVVNQLDNAAGGISGKPLFPIMEPLVRQLRKELRPDQEIIACGGVMTLDQAVAYRTAGAALVEAYTGWIYGGYGWERKIASKLK